MLIVFAATREELRVALQRMDPVRRESMPGMQCFYGRINGRDVLLVQTGVGPKKAGAAARRVLGRYAPEALVSIGAAGAADPLLQVGDAVVVRNIFHHDGGRYRTDAAGSASITRRLQDAGIPVTQGDCYTTGTFMHAAARKRQVLETTGARVIDMESASLAKRLCAAGAPFLGIRIVSDTAREEAFNIEAFYARRARAGRRGGWAYFVRRPREIPRALRLKKNVRLVARRIADILELIVR